MTHGSAAPATKAAELIGRLSALANRVKVSDFELRQLELEANKLLQLDAEQAYQILGGVASLRGDVQGVHREHKRALKLSGEAASSLRNYAISLAIVNEFEAARKTIQKSFRKDPTDQETLWRFILFSIMSGYFLEARELMERQEAEYTDEEEVRAICSAIERGSFTEGGVRKVLSASHEVMQRARVNMETVDILADEEEEGSFLFEIFLSASREKAHECNVELDERIVAQEELTKDPGLNFVPVFLGANGDVDRTG